MTGRVPGTLPIAVAIMSTLAGATLPAHPVPAAPAATTLVAAELAPLRVTHYDLRLEPLVASKSITGTVVLGLNRSAVPGEVLTLNRGELTIDAIEQDGHPLFFDTPPGMLRVTFPPGARARGPITVRYHGTPRYGLEFAPGRPVVYTIFSTSQWVVTEDAPDRRASWRLSLVVPRGWTVIAAGREVGRQPLDGDREVAEWRQDIPIPSYTFGFVAGPMTRISEKVGSVTLEYAAHGLTPEQLRTVFHESAGMLDFFRKRTGTALPGSRAADTRRCWCRTRSGRRWPGSRSSQTSMARTC